MKGDCATFSSTELEEEEDDDEEDEDEDEEEEEKKINDSSGNSLVRKKNSRTLGEIHKCIKSERQEVFLL